MRKFIFTVLCTAVVLFSGCRTLGFDESTSAEKGDTIYTVTVTNAYTGTIVIGWGFDFMGVWSGFTRKRAIVKANATKSFVINEGIQHLVYRPNTAEPDNNFSEKIRVKSDLNITIHYDKPRKKWIVDVETVTPETGQEDDNRETGRETEAT
ncbi:MAG: hypothetical protein IJ191_06885 [Treponema sp.]|nr:hypothetical protein [Treponema sp.]